MAEKKKRRARKSYGALVWEREQVDFAEEAWLRAHGWEHTSNTPGCLWLWQKQCLDGRIILVSKSTALSMQAHSNSIGRDW